MNYENLKAAIKANSDEAPSLTLAFHLIQSVIKDIEQESGQKFRNVDIGEINEYTGLLGGQIRTILNTYSVTSESLRGITEKLAAMKDRLENTEKEVRDFEKQIASMQDTDKKISEITKKRDGLKNTLEKIREKQREYEDISQVCVDMEKQIADMKNYDIPGKKREKEELEKQAGAFESQAAELNRTIQGLKEKNKFLSESLESALAIARDHEEKIRNYEISVKRANEEIDKLRAEVDSLENDVFVAQKTRESILEDLSAAKELKTRLDEENVRLRKEYDKYYNDEIEALTEKNDKMRSAIEDRESYKKGLVDQKNSLEKKYTELLQQIAKLQNEEIIELEEKLRSRASEKMKLESESRILRQKIGSLNEELDSIQQEISVYKENVKQLDEKLIPQSRNRSAKAGIEYKNKKAEADSIEKQIADLQEEIEKASKECESGLKTLNEKRKDLDELRTKLSNSNKDIEQLKTTLNELKGKTDRDSVDTIKKGLQAEIDEHKRLLKEKKELEEQCQKLRRENEADAGSVAKLSGTMTEYENEKKKLEKRLSEFRFAEDPAFFDKVRLIREKNRLAAQIRDSLETNTGSLGKALGYNMTVIHTDPEESISADLKEIDNYLACLFINMKKYAEEFIDNLGGE